MMKRILPACVLILGVAAGCGPKKSGAIGEASLDELNRALSVVAMQSRSFPPPTNELVKFLAVSGKTLPVPPAGKKLVIDPAKRQFVLVDQ